MKRVFTFIAVALLALCVKPLHAQVADNFDFEQATNYYLLVLDASTEANWSDVIDPNIVQDLRINGSYADAAAGTSTTGSYFLDIWFGGTDPTYAITPSQSLSGHGAFDNPTYFDFTAQSVGWGGGGFQALASQTPPPVDFTAMTDDYRFHMDIKKTNSFPCRINVFGTGDATGASDGTKKAQFIIGDPTATQVYGDAGILQNLTPNFKVNTWQVIDIPVSQLKTMYVENGSAQPWDNRAPFTGYYFEYEFGSDNGNNLSIDGVFFYKPVGTGIKDVNANNKLSVVVTNQTVSVLNATGPIDVYNLAGIKVKTSAQPTFGVDEVSKGAYIIKSGNAVAKVIIK